MLIKNWRAVAGGAFSMFALYVVAVLEVLPMILELLAPSVDIPDHWMTWAVLLAAVAGMIGRLIRQPEISDFLADESGAVSRRGAGVTATAAGLAILVAFVGPWEGLRTSPYPDVGGVPTVCYGETAVPMRTYTAAECRTMFEARLIEFEAGLDRLLDDPGAIPAGSKVAFVSWAYNVGLGAARSSTLIRKANAGDVEGACRELPRWNKVRGRVVQGLVNRRAAELELCLEALVGPVTGVPPILTAPVPPAAVDRPEGQPRAWSPETSVGVGVGVVLLGALLLMGRRRRRR